MHPKPQAKSEVLGGGGVLPEKLGGSVRPACQNPYPIYDLTFKSKPCFWPALS